MMKVLASSRIRFEIFEFMLGDKVGYESKLFLQPRHHHPKNTVFKRGWLPAIMFLNKKIRTTFFLQRMALICDISFIF